MTSGTNRPIIFFGTEDFSVASLQALVENDFNVVAVVTKPDSLRGRGRKLTPPSVKVYAKQQGITVWQPKKISEIVDQITAIPQPIGVLVSFGKIIPQSIIDLFSPGIINVHPSLLPQYRGPSPIESAIANGDSETGVSIMQLSAKMDAGPVYSQTRHQLSNSETQSQLYELLAQEGAKELVRVLPDIITGTLKPVPQNDEQATYCQLLSKELSFIDPATVDAATIERRIRAYEVYPKVRLPFHDQTMIVTEAHVTSEPHETTLRCQNNSYLAIDRLVSPISGKTMVTKDYLRGLQNT